MKIETSELTGAALDWAVAKCEGKLGHYVQPNEKRGTIRWEVIPQTRRYSTDWSQGGPIIERERIQVAPLPDAGWRGHWRSRDREVWMDCFDEGVTALIAAMRCYCCSKLGDIIDVPEELCQQPKN